MAASAQVTAATPSVRRFIGRDAVRPSAVLAIIIGLIAAVANAADLLFLDFFGPFRSSTAAMGLIPVAGAFAEQLRDEVDLESVRAHLLGAVGQTMSPTHASVWLRRRSP